jgi:quercetin dioxygenase-like cupin family protein
MRLKLTWCLTLLAALVTVYIARTHATQAFGFTGTTLALGRFGEIDATNHQAPPVGLAGPAWLSFQQTKGPSDVYVQNNVWDPGGSTGWHTHPGHSLIIVTAGAVTAYEGDDPSCTPHTYRVGQGFVDEGGDHVHIIRNEGAVEARTVAVQVIPAGAGRRIDAPASTDCAF